MIKYAIAVKETNIWITVKFRCSENVHMFYVFNTSGK